jgi:hypothetical protein
MNWVLEERHPRAEGGWLVVSRHLDQLAAGRAKTLLEQRGGHRELRVREKPIA